MKVSELFRSLQGEGVRIGVPTVFVRLAGCNLRCAWCDTPYAQAPEGEDVGIDEVLRRVQGYGCMEVCITGGEPLLQKDTLRLILRLLEMGYYVTLETNGTLSLQELPCEDRLTVSMDAKCPSSGMAEKCDLSNIELLGPGDQLKCVLADEADYAYALSILRRYKPKCTVVMTPVGGRDLRWIADAVLRDRVQARVLPQLHKMIWEEERER
ncbi:MAG: radical SAM protein [Candidatus Thermoplasmatota archaeon]